MPDRIKIAIAEDHDMVRQGFVTLLERHPELNIIIEASTGKLLMGQIEFNRPDIILLDIEMPGLSGIKIIELVKQRYPQIKIIVVSAHDEITSILEYVKKGADSFITKNCDINELILSIKKVKTDGRYFDERVERELARNGLLKLNKRLTERDLVFIKYLVEGKSDTEIAGLMEIKEENVTKYKRRMLLKTSSSDLEELITFLKDKGIV